jgi:hypothetical protein
MIMHIEEESESVAACSQIKDDKANGDDRTYTVQYSAVSTKIILLFSMALDETYAVFKISYSTLWYRVPPPTSPLRRFLC